MLSKPWQFVKRSHLSFSCLEEKPEDKQSQ